jgi:hypothetical protein
MLVGDNFFSECERFPLINWEKPVKLPWGDGRLAVFGREAESGPAISEPAYDSKEQE